MNRVSNFEINRSWSSLLKRDIECRLENYGFSKLMCPEKYRAYCGVRSTVLLLTGLFNDKKRNRIISHEDYVLLKAALDRIMPIKTLTEMRDSY